MAQDVRPQPLYGVWIDNALGSNDVEEMKKVLKAARKDYPPPVIQPLYGVFIKERIEAGASREELQSLLAHAKATVASDLHAAVQKLEAHLGSAGK